MCLVVCECVRMCVYIVFECCGVCVRVYGCGVQVCVLCLSSQTADEGLFTTEEDKRLLKLLLEESQVALCNYTVELR